MNSCTTSLEMLSTMILSDYVLINCMGKTANPVTNKKLFQYVQNIREKEELKPGNLFLCLFLSKCEDNVCDIDV